MTPDTVTDLLRSSPPPTDTELRTLWADGRAMLRAVSAEPPPLTPLEQSLHPAAEPKTFSAVADEWNARAARIRGPRSKSLTGLAFAGIVGFVALFGLVILTQPIRFAPLEQVSIKGEAPATGFLLLTTGRGLFVPAGQGAAQFVTATDITSVELCVDVPHWYSLSVVDYLTSPSLDGVECTPP